MNAAEMIGDAGFDVIEAGNADEATAILEARRESQQIAGPDKSKRKPTGLKRRARDLYRRCERGPEPAPLLLAVPVDCARHTTSPHVVLML